MEEKDDRTPDTAEKPNQDQNQEPEKQDPAQETDGDTGTGSGKSSPAGNDVLTSRDAYPRHDPTPNSSNL